jgi:hypothetical protein
VARLIVTVGLLEAAACSRGPYCDEVSAHLKALPGDDRAEGLTTLAEQCKSWSREQRLCYLRAKDVPSARACDMPDR